MPSRMYDLRRLPKVLFAPTPKISGPNFLKGMRNTRGIFLVPLAGPSVYTCNEKKLIARDGTRDGKDG